MAKIDRYNGNLKAFGSNATGQERVVFGDTDATQSDDLTENINPDLLRGWGALPLGNKPPREWFTAVHWVSTQLSAYLHQMGVAEWNSGQEYYSGSIAQKSSGMWVSSADDNTGSEPTDGNSNWALAGYLVCWSDAHLKSVDAGLGVRLIDASKENARYSVQSAQIGAGDIQLNNSLWAVLEIDNSTSAKSFGAAGDGLADDSQALADMSSRGTNLITSGEYRISQNTTLSGKVKFAEGASLSIDAGVTLTISDADANYSQQIFSGDGNVTGLQNSWVGWFGAVPDNSTDSSSAFNKAVQASSGAVYIPDTALGFRVLQTISINKQIEIRGMNQAKVTIGSGIDLFTISSSEIFISGLRLFGVDGTSHVCRLASSIQSIEFVYLEKIYTTACGRFIYDDNDPSNLVINLHVTDCYHRFAKDRGVWLRDAFAFVFFRKFAIDYVGVTDASSNVPAIQIENNEGSFFEDIDILGGTIAGFSGRDGFIAKNSAAVFLRRLNSDTMGGRGIVFEAANASRMETVASSLCGEDSIIITGCVSVMGCNVYVGGRKDLGGAAGKRGIVIDNTSTLVNLSNVSVLNLTGDGYVTDAITSIVNGINFNNIGGNNYDLGTATNHLVAGQNTAGALILNDTGPAVG